MNNTAEHGIIVLIIIVIFKPPTIDSGGKIPLYLAGALELSDLPPWFKYAAIMPDLIQYTLEDINNKSDILVDYDLQIIYRDVRFNAGYIARQLDAILKEDPPKVALYGPSRGEFFATSGQMVPFYNIVQAGYSETLPVMENFLLYPTTFSVFPNMHDINHLRLQFMNYFGWQRVSTISGRNAVFQTAILSFHEHIEQNNLTLISTSIVKNSDDARQIIAQLKKHDVRIIVLAVPMPRLRELLCQAYHMDMYGTGYVWIVSGRTLFGRKLISGNTDLKKIGCTKDELIEASRGHFQLNFYTVSRTNTPTISGKLPVDVMADLQRMRKEKQGPRRDYGVAVDALWSLAIGLNNSLKYLDEVGLKLHEYNYTDVYLDAVLKGMHETSFNGVSGHVSFNAKGRREGIAYLQRYDNDTIEDLAYRSPQNKSLTWLVDPVLIWPDGIAPDDCFTKMSQSVTKSTAWFACVVTIDTCGLVLSIGFLVFNIYYRNHWSVKMSSPMVNNVMLAGCLVMYICVIVCSVDYIQLNDTDTNHYICMIRVWMLALGFTTLFGALFSKTYRVYVIFRNNNMNTKHIRDVHLFGLIVILLMMDMVILVPWSLIHPMEKVEIITRTQILMDSNTILSEIYHYCHNESQAYWIAALYVYKGLLLAFGTFLAWETRHVTIPALNDSKYIGACIYNVVVVCIFGVPLAHVLPTEQSTLLFALQSCLIIFCTTICQCIIFIPKFHLRNLVQPRFVTTQMSTYTRSDTLTHVNIGDKEEVFHPGIFMNECMSLLNRGSKDTDANVATVSCAEKSKDINEIKEENRNLRMQIAKESIAIAKLRRSLQQMTGNIHFYRSGSQYVLFKMDSSKPSLLSGITNVPHGGKK